MKVAIVAPEVFPVPAVRGGALEANIQETVTRLAGQQVHVFGVADPVLPQQETRGHITYVRWKSSAIDRLLLSSYRLPFRSRTSAWYYWPYSRWVARHLRRLQPDVVVIKSQIQFVPWIRRAVPRAGVILELHQLSSLEGPAVWNRHLADCDLVVSCSQFLSDEVVHRYPAAQPKAVILHNGIDLERFHPWWESMQTRQRIRQQWGLANEPVIVYSGRLVPQKGVHVLAEAFVKLAARIPAARLVIIGSHTYSDVRETDFIRELRRTLNPLGARVIWTGYVPPERMPDLYAASDLVVVPSIGPEAFSMPTVEGMATGLPVIAFAHGGPRELIDDGRTGYLVPLEQGAAGLEDAFARLLEHPELRATLGRAGRAHVEAHFNWNRIIQRRHDVHALARERRCASTERASRIPLLIAESGSGYGGTAKYLGELVALLDRRRFDVQVVAATEGPLIKRMQDQGAVVKIVSWWKFPWFDRNEMEDAPRQVVGQLGHYLRFAAGAMLQIPLVVPAMVYWLRRRRIRLVHLNNEMGSHLALILAAKVAGCRLICHLHGWRSLTRTERMMARLVDVFICISEAGAVFHSQQLGGRHVVAIPNGLRLNGQMLAMAEKRTLLRQQLGLALEVRVVAMLGRLVPWKGHVVYLQALARARDRRPNLVGVIVGHDPAPGAPHLAALQRLAAELGLTDHLRFLPWQEDVWSLYAASDMVVHASVEPEPFGLVILEAMVAGKPVIATHAGGVVDLVQDGATGLLVPPGDAAAMAEAIVRLCDDPPLAARMAGAAQHRAMTTFTMEQNAARVTQVYERLLGERKRAGAI